MIISAFEFDIQKDKYKNLEIINDYLKNIKEKSDLVILPELSSNGYLFENRDELKNTSENIKDGIFINNLSEISKKYDTSIIAGFAEKYKDKIYNSAVIIERGNIKGIYRKIHLSDFEKRFFDYGDINNADLIFNINGINISVQICFDLWFNEISRMQILNGSNLICVLANFGSNTTFEIARIRAIENLTPIVLCNRIGIEKNSIMEASFIGKSFVCDEAGKLLTNIKENQNNKIITAEIEIKNKRQNVICSDFIEEIKRHY
ncbi:carbon-nitrogen hydrolase family protein [Brachyspira hyodysenteriae]|nr:nitrilase-related carbon-nitrogen hydrolase [Brachyspira hyodysenteriae]MCZ9890984.1 carbon-nitrogen hydrolase family protein [Brachyspira hyodysenteriae]MCZ9988779.1 carbon-nitrogen hydrolase family protein [Brachyspira hyodysenteriae]MCZ9996886.1 carbon-nitrogen hydrolase family protein [Brachyspira hyodysenteriae]MDA0000327.1 carbon-nitrogen hydrolase family protein [Brachyspira hyodysenteriae]MDA0005328.1 carbon-nitrogen hydrolase family protein [Brachyspira hyodysenteriae]